MRSRGRGRISSATPARRQKYGRRSGGKSVSHSIGRVVRLDESLGSGFDFEPSVSISNRATIGRPDRPPRSAPTLFTLLPAFLTRDLPSRLERSRGSRWRGRPTRRANAPRTSAIRASRCFGGRRGWYSPLPSRCVRGASRTRAISPARGHPGGSDFSRGDERAAPGLPRGERAGLDGAPRDAPPPPRARATSRLRRSSRRRASGGASRRAATRENPSPLPRVDVPRTRLPSLTFPPSPPLGPLALLRDSSCSTRIASRWRSSSRRMTSSRSANP